MAKRLINTVLHRNNYKYRIEVVDLLGSGLDLDHKVGVSVPGPKLSYEGNISNHTSPVIGSALEFTAFMTVDQRNDLMGVLYSDTEYSLAVGYYLYDEEDNEFLEWCGLVLPDETTETVESAGGTVTVTFNCTDGLPFLNHVNFITPDTSSFYNGEFSMAFWLREVLKKLPHWDYYFSGITSIYLKEVGLPVPSDDTYSFDTTSNTLDSSYVQAKTFYANRKRLNTKRQLPTPDESFSSSYAVLDDIMLAVGGSIVLTGGCWYVVNRTYFAIEVAASDTVPVSGYYNISSAPYYETYDGQESFIIDLSNRNDLIRSGATRTALFPYRGVSMTHENSGSDLIFGRGIGYNGFENDDVNANAPIYSVENQDWQGDAYQMSVLGTDINPSYVEGLNIPAGDEGMLTIAMSGFFSMDRKVALSSEGTSRHGVGACPIVRNVVKITDSNGKSWRLKRHVLTLNSFKSTISVSNFMDLLGFPLGLGQNEYYPKYYQNGGAYSWVGDDDPDYENTYFESMIGMDPDIVLEGSTERFLEIDYPNTKFYTPIKTEIKESNEGSDNELSVRHNDDRCRYLWRLNYNLEMPELPTGYIESFEWVSHQLLVYGPESGLRPTGNGTHTFSQTPAFRTAESTSVSGDTFDSAYEPIEYVVYGCTVKVGDGTETSDLQYLAFDTSYNGSEVHSLGETRIGSSYQNRFYGLNGKIRAALYDGPVQLTAREDNLYWSPRYDNTVVENALLYLNCAEFMQLRYRTRQMVSMSIIDKSGLYNDFIRPINLIKTNVLGVGGEEILMPIAMVKSMEDASAEFFVVAFDRDAPLEAVDSNGRNPFDTDSPSGPGITDGSNDGPGAISNIKNLIAINNDEIDQATKNISDTELFSIFIK